LNSGFETEEIDKPVYSACRIAISASAAIALLNGVASSLKISSVEPKAAIAVILTAIVIYGQIWTHLNLFNLRYDS
jgi:hypothetical protein